MIFPNRDKPEKPEKIRKPTLSQISSQKALKVAPKVQIAQIKSVILQKTHQLTDHTKKQSEKSLIKIKESNSKISQILKDFNYNFSILDADKSQMLNYSRFSILLQSMYFINCPAERSLEERSLVLKAWKLIRTPEDKYIWKNNAFTLFACIMKLHDKSFPSHKDASGLGKMVKGIYCVKKDEVKNISQAFNIFYENRKRTFTSTSPENRALLKRNLSFDIKKGKSSNICDLLSSELKTSRSLEFTDQQIQSSVLYKDTDSRVNDTLYIDGVNSEYSKIAGIKEQDSLNESLNDSVLKSRLRIRLTTQVMQKNPKKIQNESNCLFRSMTVNLNESQSFVAGDLRGKDGEDTDFCRGKRNLTSASKVHVRFREESGGNVILQALLPNGVHEMIVVRKEEIKKTLIDELVNKFDLTGENATEFRRQIYLQMSRWCS